MVGRSRAVLVLLLAACDARDVAPGDAGEDATAYDSSCPFCSDASFSYDAPAPTSPDALPPPDVSCADDAGDAGECPLPRSICVDPQWLEYFDNGTCDDAGQCHFDIAFQSCTWGCFEGGCGSFHGTAAP